MRQYKIVWSYRLQKPLQTKIRLNLFLHCPTCIFVQRNTQQGFSKNKNQLQKLTHL